MAAIEIDDNGVCISAQLLGELLDLPSAQIQSLMAAGEITSRHERGVDEDAGRHRLTFVYRGRRARLTVDGAGRILMRSRVSGATTPDAVPAHASVALEVTQSEAGPPASEPRQKGDEE